jgi:hypothetical protein
MSGYEQHKFFCIQCAREGLPIQRKVNHKYGKHHMKKLWCPWCKMEMNHIECRNDQEIKEFKENYAAGVYKNEVEESLKHITHINTVWG